MPSVPKRIVSLVPSQTELLHDLGLDEEVVGITKFCVHPEVWYKEKIRIGGTKDFKVEEIRKLQPDLIIANKEENDKERLEILMAEFPVWVSDVKTYEDALGMIRGLGLVLDRIDEAEELVSKIARLKPEINRPLKKCTYLIWKKPYMTIGGDTFISNMLECAGFENVFKSSNRYPQVTLEQLRQTETEYILLSSEPYPFATQHLEELETKTRKKVLLVDGEAFSWYGSRILESWEYFTNLEVLIGGEN